MIKASVLKAWEMIYNRTKLDLHMDFQILLIHRVLTSIDFKHSMIKFIHKSAFQ